MQSIWWHHNFLRGFVFFFSLFVFYLLWSNLLQNNNSEYPIVYIVYRDGNKIRSNLLITLLVYWTDLLTKSNRRYKYVKYNISRYIIGTLECYIKGRLASKHPFVALNIAFSAHFLFLCLNSSLLSILYPKKRCGGKTEISLCQMAFTTLFCVCTFNYVCILYKVKEKM